LIRSRLFEVRGPFSGKRLSDRQKWLWPLLGLFTCRFSSSVSTSLSTSF